MTTGTGLDAQLGLKLESTYGTAVTVDKFYEFNEESLAFEPTWLEPSALRVGTKYKREGRVVQSRTGVNGSVSLEHSTRGMGTIWKWLLASGVTTPTQIAATTAYSQIHTPGDYMGKSMTVQVGRPEPGGTVRAHTFAGCKATSWEFSVSDNEYAMLSFDVDGKSEATDTALATASYTSGASVFNFAQASTFKLGGTASTTSGETSVASGTAVTAVVRGITIRGENPMATERYGLGNSGLKNEPLENAIPTITGSMEAEWDKATFYDAFKANTTTAVELMFVGDEIASTGSYNTLSIILPAVKFKASPFQVGGPDVVSGSLDFEAYSDETNPVIQVKLISEDSAAL